MSEQQALSRELTAKIIILSLLVAQVFLFLVVRAETTPLDELRAEIRKKVLDVFFAMKSKMTKEQWEAVFKDKKSD